MQASKQPVRVATAATRNAKRASELPSAASVREPPRPIPREVPAKASAGDTAALRCAALRCGVAAGVAAGGVERGGGQAGPTTASEMFEVSACASARSAGLGLSGNGREVRHGP